MQAEERVLNIYYESTRPHASPGPGPPLADVGVWGHGCGVRVLGVGRGYVEVWAAGTKHTVPCEAAGCPPPPPLSPHVRVRVCVKAVLCAAWCYI